MKIKEYSIRKALQFITNVGKYKNAAALQIVLEDQFELENNSSESKELLAAVLECEPSLIPEKWFVIKPNQHYQMKILGSGCDGIHPYFSNVYKRKLILPDENN